MNDEPVVHQWTRYDFEPLDVRGDQPYRFSCTPEDGSRIDIPNGAEALMYFDGAHLYLRVIESDGMTDHRMDRGIVRVSDAMPRYAGTSDDV